MGSYWGAGLRTQRHKWNTKKTGQIRKKNTKQTKQTRYGRRKQRKKKVLEEKA